MNYMKGKPVDFRTVINSDGKEETRWTIKLVEMSSRDAEMLDAHQKKVARSNWDDSNKSVELETYVDRYIKENCRTKDNEPTIVTRDVNPFNLYRWEKGKGIIAAPIEESGQTFTEEQLDKFKAELKAELRRRQMDELGVTPVLDIANCL